jgi:Flp pilus assembly pilin Flp
MKTPASGKERGATATGAGVTATVVATALLIAATTSAEGVRRRLVALGDKALVRPELFGDFVRS